MWVANFVFCTMMGGCVAVTFNDQREFVTEAECDEYTEQKSDLVVAKMNEKGIIGEIFYDCKFKGDGLKV